MSNPDDDDSSHELTTPHGVISQPNVDGTLPRIDISEPNKHDVLCGRGGNTFKHYGNSTYRELVNLNKKLYLTVKKKEKCRIAQAIVEAIRYRQVPNGRFLEKQASTGLWNDIGDEKAISKTSQALRENAPMIRKELRSSKSSLSNISNASVETSVKSNEKISQSRASINSVTSESSAVTIKATSRKVVPEPEKEDFSCKPNSALIVSRQPFHGGDIRSETSSHDNDDDNLAKDLPINNAYQVSGSYDEDDDEENSEDEIKDDELISNMVDKMRSSFISHDGSLSLNQSGQRPSVRFAATTNFLADVGEENSLNYQGQGRPMSVRAAAAAAAAAFDEFDDDTVTMSLTGNGHRYEQRPSVRFSMDAETKEVLKGFASARATHRSSIFSAVSDVSLGFEDGVDFDVDPNEDQDGITDMDMSKASGNRGTYAVTSGDGKFAHYAHEYGGNHDDDYLEANNRRNRRTPAQRRESSHSHVTMATVGTSGTSGTSGTMGTIQKMEKRDSVMSSLSQFTFSE